ncbi:alcohol dehydrogenase [Lentilactobacillus buchneri subsp. silagei]|uniref:alcohol dehydrogenase catalytic domain-containing protein n=1 Tax=Lentilactobacillus buchneri TaxID=1581 RepID=UPI0012E4B602|nr:alcohol dehydrogenase catalytic domain-containing protein [Lentilactobacillus buchneri]GED95949.1 alcohol dehydrogenase [Lentilactobacillus buchneri subsp. silagei]
MNTMKAMVLEAFNHPLQMREYPIPEPAQGEVRIKVKATGICFTDVKIYRGLMGALSKKLPIVMGHEVAGIVDAIGTGVKEVSVGDRVALYIYDSCGHCRFCKKNRPYLCEDPRGQLGISRNGGYEEYLTWSADNLIKIPDNVPFEYAAVATDAVTTCVHALCERISLNQGDTILIMGTGGLGSNAVQVAKAMGAVVFAADIDDIKLEAVKKLGADYIFNTRKCDLVKEIHKLTNNNGVDYTAEFAGIKETTELAFRCLGPAGTQVQPGYSPGKSFETDYLQLLLGERAIVSSRAANKGSVQKALQLISEGKIIPQIDPTATGRLEDVNELLQRLMDGKVVGRALIRFDD